MNELMTTIKFVADETSSVIFTSNAATNAVTSTGDATFIIGSVIVGLVGMWFAWFVLFKKNFLIGNHVDCCAVNKCSILKIVSVCVILLSTICIIVAFQSRAMANQNVALTCDKQVIATVDMECGNTTFSEVKIQNNTECVQEVQKFSLQIAPDIKSINNIIWKITIGDIVVFDGKACDPQAFKDPFFIEPWSSKTMKVEVQNLSGELAKSLVGKDVATASTGYVEIPLVKYYTGKVLTPNKDASAYVGVANAKVTFDINGTIYTASNIAIDGSFTIDNVVVGTAGKLNVTGPLGEDWTTETLNIEGGDAQEQYLGEFYISKIKSFKVETSTNPVNYYPLFNNSFYADIKSHIPDGFKIYKKDNQNKYIEFQNLQFMTDLTNDKDNLYYSNIQINSKLTCVALKNETFDLAFGSQTAVEAGQKADSYNKSTGTFEDKEAIGTEVTCENLKWYSKKDNFPEYYICPSYTPAICGIAIDVIQTAYNLDNAHGGLFWSCVSYDSNPQIKAFRIISNSGHWANVDRDRIGFGVVFSRVFA